MEEKQTIWSYLSTNYVQVIAIVVLGVILIPLIIPISIPISITPMVKSVYDTIDGTSSEDIILIKFDVTPGHWAEQGPTMEAVLTHIIRRGIKFIFINTDARGAATQTTLINLLETNVPEFKDYTYGTDWAEVGFIAGGESAIVSFGEDVWGTVNSDDRGTPLEELPIFESIKTAEDFDIVIDAASSMSDPYWLIRQWHQRYGTRLFVVHIIFNEPELIPFYSTGQYEGMVLGAKGGSQYEMLIDKPGKMVLFMGSANLTLIVVVIVIAAGNVEYFMSKRRNDA